MKIIQIQPKEVEIPEIFGDDNAFSMKQKDDIASMVKGCAVIHAVKVTDGGPFGHGVLIYAGARDLDKCITNK